MEKPAESRTVAEIRADRLAKKALLEEKGLSAYPSDTKRTHSILKLKEEFAARAEDGSEVTIAGRIVSVREHGGSVFIDLFDGTGTMQGYVKEDVIGAELFTFFNATVDRSDIIEISGPCFTTKRGEPSVEVKGFRMLAKSLMPVPDAHFGIKDEDERYRKRYLDILLNPALAEMARRRSTFWNTMRQWLLAKDFIEVETPVLENTTGGADARPFVTHHNALDIDVYLRISAGELWQKKLMVAGLPRTFEIGRIFRNEGMSNEHLQDYTQLEFYMAFAEYREGMEMITDLYRTVAEATFGTQTFTIGEFTVDLSKEWERYDYCSIISEKFGFDPRTVSFDEARAALEKIHHPAATEPGLTLERAVDTLWKQVRKSLAGPGFLINVPVYLEPLAKRSVDDPRVVERFQIILAGSEMGKGFSELNDPVDQRERFLHQEQLRAQGDAEAQMNDESFVEALEYGMPPTFGFGVSERLFSFLSNVSVREGQLFPLMRPKE